MAKAKRKTKVSKGERRSISKSSVIAARAYVSVFDGYMNKLTAWGKRQNPWITVETGNPASPFQRVKANDIWGDPRKKKVVVIDAAAA